MSSTNRFSGCYIFLLVEAVTSSKKSEGEEKAKERKSTSKLVERTVKDRPRAAPYSKPKKKGEYQL